MADGRSKEARQGQPVDEETLHQKIGQQAIEIDFLKKKLRQLDCSTSRDDGTE
jgi:hypothetical protein